MSVLVLMYHKTPAHSTSDVWDVAFPLFRSHIDALIDMRTEFVKFSDLENDHYFRDEKQYVSITFDDGHMSNLDAFAYLQQKNITPAAFIVGHWASRDKDFLSPQTISGLATSCEFGTHGMTHRALPGLSRQELELELTASRKLLQEALGKKVNMMSAPGGKLNAEVIATADALGFRVIGNSVPLINYRKRTTVNRIALNNTHSARYIRKLVEASPRFWMRRQAQLAISTVALATLGSNRYSRFRSLISRN